MSGCLCGEDHYYLQSHWMFRSILCCHAHDVFFREVYFSKVMLIYNLQKITTAWFHNEPSLVLNRRTCHPPETTAALLLKQQITLSF